MNNDEILNRIEEDMLSVVRQLDLVVEERFSIGTITTEQFLQLSSCVRIYSNAGRNIYELLRSI
jgi:hypothetical protein